MHSVIKVSLVATKHSSTFSSKPVHHAGFIWTISGTSVMGHCGFKVKDIVIRCAIPPYEGAKRTLWFCQGVGNLVLTSTGLREERVNWSQTFDVRHGSSAPLKLEFCDRRPFPSDGANLPSNWKLKVYVSIQRHASIRLPSPDDDHSTDAQILVADERFWVPKELLCASSSFFAALFNTDCLERETGIIELKAITATEFRHFLSLLYGLRVPVNARSNAIADYFLCDGAVVAELFS